MPILAGFMVPHPPLIVPAIGKGGEEQILDTTKAYERVAEEIAALQPDTLIITSPHSVMYADYFHISPGSKAEGSFRQFRAPGVRFSEQYDTELVNRICELADAENLPAGTLGERDKDLDHGTMVPLWFIRNKYTKGKLVRIGLSGLPLTEHYRLGQLIPEAAAPVVRQRVGLVDKQHAAYGRLEFLLHGFRCPAHVFRHKIAAAHLHQLSFLT